MKSSVPSNPNRPSIHYSELPPANPNDADARAWETYRRELPRLLAEGHEGKFALLHDDEVVGIFDTFKDGVDEGSRRYFLKGEQFLVQSILTYIPLLQTRMVPINQLVHSSP